MAEAAINVLQADQASDSESGASVDYYQTKVLHLAGSVESKFLFDLSLMYCKTSWEALTPAFPNSWLAVVTPEKMWYFTQDFETATTKGKPLSEKAALEKLKEMKMDVVIPHMFCNEGMTTYRKYMTDLNIKLMGNPAEVCAVAGHKQRTKDVVGKAGVRVPQGVFIKDIKDAPKTFAFPCIVKPVDTDNSVGVTFCKTQQEYEAALPEVFKVSPGKQVMVEEYIPGEEVRCALIEQKDGSLRALPKIRYILETPIRGVAQKLVMNEKKEIKGYATKPSQTECPAKLDKKKHAAIEEAAKKAHEALGCELYSLYDFRVNEKEVVMLEACLFCSFSPKSVLPTLARKEDINAIEFFHNMLEVRLSRDNAEKEVIEAKASS